MSMVTVDRPVDIAHKRLEKMLWKIAHKFQRQFGGDFDDWKSQANECFMDAWQSYQPDRGASLVTWVYRLVTQKLYKNWLREHKRSQRTIPLNESLTNDGLYDPPSLLEEFSSDAKTIIDVALELDPPGRTTKKRSALVDALQELGWTGARIAESIGEIREALS